MDFIIYATKRTIRKHGTMAKEINEIANIYSGYPFRRSVEHNPEGPYAVIQTRDLTDYRTVNYRHLTRVSDIQPRRHHLLRKGDILFVAKGVSHIAVSITKELNNVVASANFLVVRITSEQVLADYLAWYIWQKPAQQFFREHAPRSFTSSVSKAVLSRLRVPIPPLEKQRKILRMQLIADEERELMQQIQAKRAQMIESILLNAAKEHSL